MMTDMGAAQIVLGCLFSAPLAYVAFLLMRGQSSRQDDGPAWWTALAVFPVSAAVGVVFGLHWPVLALAVIGLWRLTPRLTRRSCVAILVILGSVWIAYLGLTPLIPSAKAPVTTSAVANDFAYDDKDLISNNDFLAGWMAGAPNIRDEEVDYWKELLTKDFAQLTQKAAGAPGLRAINYYRPVIAMSYMMDYWFWSEVPAWASLKEKDKQRSELKWKRLEPFGFHLTNVLVHALNSLLVFLLVRSLARRYWLALATAVLFAVHPVHTETVCWIAGRTDGIATTFFLSAFWTYLRFRHTGSWPLFGVAVLLTVVGTFTKEMTAALGFILVAYELLRWLAARHGAGDLYLPSNQVASLKRQTSGDAIMNCLPAVGVFVAGIGLYFMVKNGIIPAQHKGPRVVQPAPMDPWFLVPWSQTFFSMFGAIWWYIGKAFWPQPLNIYPSVEWVKGGMGWLLMLSHLLILAAGVGLLLFRRARLLSFALIGFYLSLGPVTVNNLFPKIRLLRFTEDVDYPVSERFLYIPSLFACLAVGWIVAWAVPRLVPGAGKLVAGVALLAIVVGCVVVVQQRNVDWQDDFHLFESGVRSAPYSVRMANNYGFELLQAWRIRDARRELTRCTTLVSEANKKRKMRAPMPVAYQNLGHSYYLQGDFLKAVQNYQKSFEQDPNAVAANNLGALMGIFGSITLNIELIRNGFNYYQRAVKLAPDYVFAKQSVRFMQQTYNTWVRYLQKNDRRPLVVLSFGNSFLHASSSISHGEDPRYLQAMLILDSGLRRLPTDEEMKKIFPGTPEELLTVDAFVRNRDQKYFGQVKRVMGVLFDECFTKGVEKYRKIIDKPQHSADNPDLNYILGQIHLVAWRRTKDPGHEALARRHTEVTFKSQADHSGAARGLIELARANKDYDRAFDIASQLVTRFLQPQLPFEGLPRQEPAARPKETLDLTIAICNETLAMLPATDPKLKPERDRWQKFLRDTVQRCVNYLQDRASTRLGGEDAESWNNLGYFKVERYKLFREKADLDKALEHLDYALRLDPKRPGPALNKIHVLKMRGQAREAELFRREMQQRHPQDPRFMPPRAPGQPTRMQMPQGRVFQGLPGRQPRRQ